jgi:RND family efflux transporter MFP subunit
VITKRNVDVGDLIDAGGGAGRALFVLAQTDPLRVYVNVPQSYAQLVKVGQQVVVTQTELRGAGFKGEISRTAASIDAATRTMQVEITLPNKDGTLLPGAFVQVALPLQPSGVTTIPTNALMIRAEGPRVAAVDAEGMVHLRAVRIGRNYGQAIEVLDGVTPADRLVLNPPDSLNDGDAVSIIADAPKKESKK